MCPFTLGHVDRRPSDELLHSTVFRSTTMPAPFAYWTGNPRSWMNKFIFPHEQHLRHSRILGACNIQCVFVFIQNKKRHTIVSICIRDDLSGPRDQWHQPRHTNTQTIVSFTYKTADFRRLPSGLTRWGRSMIVVKFPRLSTHGIMGKLWIN